MSAICFLPIDNSSNCTQHPLNANASILEAAKQRAAEEATGCIEYLVQKIDQLESDSLRFETFEEVGNIFEYKHDEIQPLSEWGNNTLPLEKVGAGIGYWTSFNSKEYILFNHTGTQYYISGASNNFGGDGPYDL